MRPIISRDKFMGFSCAAPQSSANYLNWWSVIKPLRTPELKETKTLNSLKEKKNSLRGVDVKGMIFNEEV